MIKEDDILSFNERLVYLAQKARREGLLVLEDEMEDIDDPFLRNGLQMVVDGFEPDAIRYILNEDISAMEFRHEMGQNLYRTWGMLTPAFGMIGTLIGLVMMLVRLDDPSKIGSGMAIALLTTFYGVLLSNLVFIPLAGKLNISSLREVRRKQVIVDSLLALQGGVNPRILQEQLKVYLSPTQRENYREICTPGKTIKMKRMWFWTVLRKRSSRENNQSSLSSPHWMTTYSDMVTLLLAFFVLLFTFSQIDVEKFNKILASIQLSFLGYSGVLDGGIQPPPGQEHDIEIGEDVVTPEELLVLEKIRQAAETLDRVRYFLSAEGLSNDVDLRLEERGIVMELPDRIFFDAGMSDLKPQAFNLLNKLALLFEGLSNRIVVEGHTCDIPMNTARHPSNWELSVGRSVPVTRYLAEVKGLDPNRFIATGYGEYQPLFPNDSPENRARNRRVTVVIATF